MGYRLEVDIREKKTKLAELAATSGVFEVNYAPLRVGDYIVDRSVLIERKSFADLAASILDGRLFRQASAMARLRIRTLFLIEGTPTAQAPNLHPHSILGACISLALIWRQPILFSKDPQESLTILRLAAEQAGGPANLELTRCGYRPKRTARRKLFVLQGLPGVGPKLAASLLRKFGSVEKVMSADARELMEVHGCGAKKSAAIREVIS